MPGPALRRPTSSSRNRRLLLALVAAVASAAITAGVSSVDPSRAASGGTDIFSVSCRPSHIAPDDPIVFPGQPGAAHMHEFSGAWSTNAFTTPESLVASGTSCDPAEDTGAYWMPVLYVKGKRVPVEHTTGYYAKGRKNSDAQRTAIKAWPQGFRMIADMKNSTIEKTGYPHAGWLCGSSQVKWGYESSLTDISYHCPYNLQARVIFPDCWDGVNLDTVNPDGTPAVNPVTHEAYPNDHRSHVAYALDGGECPPDHPVGTPRLDFKITYQTKGLVDSAAHRPAVFTNKSKIQADTPYDPPQADEGDSPSDFTVAGGGMNGMPINNGYDVDTFHADFYNGWDQDALEHLIDYCIRRQQAQTNTRPCLNPNSDAVQDATPNPNFPNATAPTAGTTITAGPTNPTPIDEPSSFAFKSNLPNATFACKLDGGEFAPCSSPQTYPSLPAGPHTFVVRASADGRTDEIPAARTWVVGGSESSPVVKLTAPAAGQAVSGALTAIATATEPPATIDGTNVDRVEFLLDGELQQTDAASPYEYPLDTTKLANGQHTLSAIAYDDESPSNAASDSVTFTVANRDPAAPADPVGVTAVATDPTTMTLSWEPGADADGVATHYRVFRDGVAIGTTTDHTFTDRGLADGATHTYRVQAVDAAGHASAGSSPSSAATPPRPDVVAPSAPANLAAEPVAPGQVNLSWSASTDGGGSGVKGYNVYRDGSSTPLNASAVTTTSYGDATVTGTTSYTYRVEAVDAAGNVSAPATVSVATTSVDYAPTVDHAPDVTVNSPVPGQTVGGKWQVDVVVSDDDRIDKAELLIDGVIVARSDVNNAEYGIRWTTSEVPNGSHEVRVRATDIRGHATTTPPIRVTVAN